MADPTVTDQAIEIVAETLQQRSNPMCPWAESELADLYREEAHAVLVVAVPILLAALADEIEAGPVSQYREAADIAWRQHKVRYELPDHLRGLADAAEFVRSAAGRWQPDA